MIEQPEFLMEAYSKLRSTANEVALELERQGYKGFYIRGTTGEQKPLDPSTRPTEFVWEKNDDAG